MKDTETIEEWEIRIDAEIAAKYSNKEIKIDLEDEEFFMIQKQNNMKDRQDILNLIQPIKPFDFPVRVSK